MYFVKEEIYFLAAVISCIEYFLKEKALMMACNKPKLVA